MRISCVVFTVYTMLPIMGWLCVTHLVIVCVLVGPMVWSFSAVLCETQRPMQAAAECKCCLLASSSLCYHWGWIIFLLEKHLVTIGDVWTGTGRLFKKPIHYFSTCICGMLSNQCLTLSWYLLGIDAVWKASSHCHISFNKSNNKTCIIHT